MKTSHNPTFLPFPHSPVILASGRYYCGVTQEGHDIGGGITCGRAKFFDAIERAFTSVAERGNSDWSGNWRASCGDLAEPLLRPENTSVN
jgi:hypothetical protein